MDNSEYIMIDDCQSQFKIDHDKIISICMMIFQTLSIQDHELNVQFVESSDMQHLNKEFREKDYVTDVLSFPQIEWPEPLLTSQNLTKKTKKKSGPPKTLGDLVICIEAASSNAKEIGHTTDREVCFLLVHGILHLCGHDHIIDEEEKIMIAQQKYIMNYLESNSTPPIWTNCIQERGQY